jgi:hypothetical protein
MTKYDFEVNYATWVKDSKSETTLMINPLHTSTTGSMVIRNKDGFEIGGEYTLRQDESDLYFGWRKVEYLISPNKEGFDLLIGETVQYSFTKIP